ncbi:MAG: PAS domain S-box protein [Spirochaetaceae bacterium]
MSNNVNKINNKNTILLVEDEAIIALATARSLESRGYRVLSVHTGEDAVREATLNPDIDLVLMDIDLGSGIDGTEAAQRILAARTLPVVFLSSHTEQSLVDKVRGITRYGYVVKDSGDFVLNASIEMAFELYEAHRREQAHVERYRAVVQALPDLMFVMSGDGTFKEAYASDPDLLAVPIDEIPGMRLHDAFGDEESKRHLGYYRACLDSGKTQSFHYELFLEGALRTFEARLSRAGEDTVLAIVRDITDRRRIEKVLEKQTRLQRALVDVATSCINPSDADLPGTIRRALGAMAETIGADRAYIFDYVFAQGIAVNTHEWCAPGIEPQMEKLQAVPLEDIAAGIELHQRGLAHHLPDLSGLPEGPLRRLLESQGIKSLLTVPLLSDGECVGAVGFDRVRQPRDFSQEEHELLSVFAEVLVNSRKRQEAEEFLRVLFDAARDNILVHEVGPDGTPGPYVDVNPSTCETLGYTREELLSMSPIDTTDGNSAEGIRSILSGLANGESVLIEATGRRKDGVAVPFELNLHRLKLRGRDSVIAISRDIFRRKRKEEMQRRINEMAPVAIFVFDHNQGRLAFANPEYQRQLGYSLEELQAMGDRLTETIYHPDARERLYEVDRSIRADREGRVFETDYKIRRKNGSTAWGFVRETVLSRNPDGSPEQVIGIGVDVSTRKEAEQKIAGLLKEKELLLTEVHHRIKNNMTLMISMLSLQAGAADDSKVVEALTEAESRMHSMAVLYDKLYRSRTISEISLGDYLPSLVREIVATHGAEGRVTLSFDVGDCVLPVSAVAGLGVIVNELISNALKHAFPGGSGGTITVAIEGGSGCRRLVIADNGVGLPESVGPGRSAGFGLMLVSSLADQHGFEVSAERQAGTRFVIELGQSGVPAGRSG